MLIDAILIYLILILLVYIIRPEIFSKNIPRWHLPYLVVICAFIAFFLTISIK